MQNKRASRADVVDRVAAKTGMTKASVEAVVNETLNTIAQLVDEGSDVAFVGFGKFRRVNVATRQGRNPQTGEVLTVEGGPSMRFTTSSALTRTLRASL